MGNKLAYPEVSLEGKVAVVTGGNTGIGYEVAKALARLGAHTFIACRSQERAEAAIDRMKEELNPKPTEEEKSGEEKDTSSGKGKDATANGEEDVASSEEVKAKNYETSRESQREIKVEYLPLDLASIKSTIDFVRAFKEKSSLLHILVNNAAVAFTPFELTEDGFELQLQVNTLSPLLLTLELLPVLQNTATSTGSDVRILFVSSAAHKFAPAFNPSKILTLRKEDHDRIKAYANSKLYDLMLGFALQRRLKDYNITVSSPEPGYVKTEIDRGFKDKGFIHTMNKLVGYPVFARSPAKGAVTIINSAINPELNTLQHFYYSDCRVVSSSRDSRNEEFQEVFWKKSTEILKDYLSPDIMEQYQIQANSADGAPTDAAPPSSATGGTPTQLTSSPTDDTPIKTPSSEQPPTDDTPTETPSSEQPPTDDTPIETPSSEQPSTDDTLAENPSSEQPPTDDTLTENPSSEQPPTDDTPTETPS